MTSSRVRLWDANRHEAYVRERDQALERRLDEREGTSIAMDIDTMWLRLPQDEREALAYLVVSGARCCVASSTRAS
jgi:phosphoserine phosphatase